MTTYLINCKCCEETTLQVFKKPTKKTQFVCNICKSYCKHLGVKLENSNLNKFKKITTDIYLNEYTQYTIIKHNPTFYEVRDNKNQSVWEFPTYKEALICANDSFLTYNEDIF